MIIPRLQSAEVRGLGREFFFDPATHQVAQLEDHRIGDEVENAEAFFAAADHVGVGQDGEMLGDVRLRGSGFVDQSGDVLFALLEGHEQFQSHRLAQNFEAMRDQEEGFARNLFSGGFAGHQKINCVRAISLYRYIIVFRLYASKSLNSFIMKIETLSAFWPLLLGILVGGLIGATLGYFGQCSSGACPLTANPWRGAIFGALFGFLFAFSWRTSPAEPSEPPSSKRSAEQWKEISRSVDAKRTAVNPLFNDTKI